jgi:hypothetical protein
MSAINKIIESNFPELFLGDEERGGIGSVDGVIDTGGICGGDATGGVMAGATGEAGVGVGVCGVCNSGAKGSDIYKYKSYIKTFYSITPSIKKLSTYLYYKRFL